MTKQPAQESDQSRGLLDATPCPWCRKANDFREESAIGVLEAGNSFTCTYCNRKFVVEQLKQTTIIRLKRC